MPGCSACCDASSFSSSLINPEVTPNCGDYDQPRPWTAADATRAETHLLNCQCMVPPSRLLLQGKKGLFASSFDLRKSKHSGVDVNTPSSLGVLMDYARTSSMAATDSNSSAA